MTYYLLIAILGALLLPQTGSRSDSQSYVAFSLEQSSRRHGSKTLVDEDRQPVAAVFKDISAGLTSGEIQTFSKHFGRQVYVDLRGVESGYFSSNQTFYILQNYFLSHKIRSFTFSTVNDTGESPFATGGGTFSQHGTPEIFQIYVALANAGDQWVISQFNVY